MRSYLKWTAGLALGALATMAGAAVSTTLASGAAAGANASYLGYTPPGLAKAAPTAAPAAQSNASANKPVAQAIYPFDARFNAGDTLASPAKKAKGNQPGTFIVQFSEAPVASYRGEIPGLAAPKMRARARGALRADMQGIEARSYAGYLQARQRTLENRMNAVAGHKLPVRQRMQHALNAIIVEMTAAEAKRVRKLPGVLLVEPYREYPLHTDVGPALIGAPAVWAGTGTGIPAALQGEGIVAAIIDTGINFGSPSFSAVDPIDGYAHVNPLGAGTYLGSCAPGQVDDGRCNDKLIGGYDFVCNAPGNQCGIGGIREEPGFGDTNSHGSHTASTVAGNRRDAAFFSGLRRISGVAPRANIIAYDVCYTNISTGGGSCPNVSTVAAIDQTVADGIVDVINYSIGGGTSPWTELTSLAFLNASNAGIFVSTSAGNSGPSAGTVSHVEPWTSGTAASNHGRGGFRVLMSVTGPGTVPADLAPLLLNEGTGGVAFGATIPGTTPLVISPGIATTSDGCAAYPAGTFTGAIAVIRRGTCSFAIKTNNASAAGAIAAVLANNTGGEISPSVPGTTIPAFGATQASGDALAAFVGGLGDPTLATAGITFPPQGVPNVADALAGFSSRGPVVGFDILKPDVTAPGVDILAVLSGTTLTGSENLVGLMSGTSMASPHAAGSAALIRQAKPTWTPAEVKSALALTATTVVFTEDTVTPADSHQRGAGRVRVDRAINAGLVMNETGANYTAANPGTAGDPSTLNTPGFADRTCFPTCTFTRTFRNTRSFGALWQVQLVGLPGTLSASNLWLPVGASASVTVTVNGAALVPDGTWDHGSLRLNHRRTGNQIDDGSTLAMPVAVFVPPPILSLPASATLSLQAGTSGSAPFTVANAGGAPLDFTIANTGNGAATFKNQSAASNTGFRSAIWQDPATAGNQAQLAADDVTLQQTTTIKRLVADFGTVSGATLPASSTQLTFAIYPDAAGVPAGNPHTNPGAGWTFTTPIGGAGVSINGGRISLDLAAAGQNVVLAPGRHWVVVNGYPAFANRWLWILSDSADPTVATLTISAGGTGNWVAVNQAGGLALQVYGEVACGAPWLGAPTPLAGTLTGGTNTPASIAVDAAALPAASYRAFACFTSNDPLRATAAMPVEITVTP